MATAEGEGGITPLAESKRELLDLIHRSRGALEQQIDGLNDETLTRAPAGGWSVKDHLAHIAAWERFVLARLAGSSEAEAFDLDAAELMRMNTDGVNAILYRRSRDLLPVRVRDEFRASHQALLDAPAAIDEARLFQSVAEDDPRLWMEKIANDSYRHYAEHRAWIEVLVGPAVGG